MKPSKIPHSIAVGSIFYSYTACSYDDGTSSVIEHEWHVRSIQNKSTWIDLAGTNILNSARKTRFVSMASKVNGLTWVKGAWTKYIPKDHLLRFEFNKQLPEGVYTTKLQAIKYAIEVFNTDIHWYETKLAEINQPSEAKRYSDDLLALKKELKLLKGKLTRLRNSSK
ncbi:hypothetical protein AB6E94_19245 [Vibrio lentus]|uniref:hypothetical protein n=1 Tax=Vibrio splendidus TaxID=29497 RepID=UPI000C828663|nr:hypothetical protein [Vibrio splendidus]PMG17837.1 hypothetical protein BCU98_00460 [Vibrio splendidus]